ncbi:MAG TPA: ATP-binding protein [Opitutaceae bacterium]|jgi:PAS domain S-box-containing protein|nr:ATP-binding protein [Opitutaceae bacterium]
MLSNLPIRRKLTVIILGTSLTALVLMRAVTMGYEYLAFQKSTVRQVSTIGEITAANSSGALAFENQSDAREILSSLKAERNIQAAALYDKSGHLFSKYPDDFPDDMLPGAPGPDGYKFRNVFMEGFQPVSEGANKRLGTLYLRFNTGAVLAQWLQFTVGLAVAGIAIVLLVSYLMSRRLQRQISSPIMELANAASAVSKRQDFSVRAEKFGNDELGRLTDTFNQMLEEIQKRNASIKQNEIQLQAIVENLGEGVVVSDLDGRLLRSNMAAVKLHGFENEAEFRNSFGDSGDSFVLEKLSGEKLTSSERPLSRILNGEHLRNVELVVRRKESEWRRIFNYGGTVVMNADGKPHLAILTIEDISERKNAENEILGLNSNLELRVKERTSQLEEANNELEAFSYSVSHDLRAPLRHIDGFAGLLAKGSAHVLDEKGRRHLSTISTAAKQMGRLIDDLLSFCRTGRAELNHSTLDHDGLVASVIRDGRYDESERKVTWEISSLPRIDADMAMLRQVWVNLVSNAVKYSSKAEHPRITIGSLPDAHQLEHVFFVRDNGVGFDMKYVEKLFGVFQRLHTSSEFEGTGIGLANVRRIVTRHGGRAWAEGSIGNGATMYFSLPKSRNGKAHK